MELRDYFIIKSLNMPKINKAAVQKKMNKAASKPSPGKPKGKNTSISIPKKGLKKGR